MNLEAMDKFFTANPGVYDDAKECVKYGCPMQKHPELSNVVQCALEHYVAAKHTVKCNSYRFPVVAHQSRQKLAKCTQQFSNILNHLNY